MKNLWKSLFVAALMVSCSEANVEENPAPEATNGKPIQFELVNEGGRAAFFQGEGHQVNWEGGESIGVRRWSGYGEDATYNSAVRQRANYTVDVNGVLTLSNYYAPTYSTDPDSVTYITAFYPATANANANSIGNVSVPNVQVQAAANDYSHIDDYMLMMTAKPLAFAYNEHPDMVSLQLKSVLSIVEITLKGDAEQVVAALELETNSESPLGFPESNKVNMMDTTKDITAEDAACPITVGTGYKSVKLSLTTPAPLSAEGTKFYFVVLPGTHAKGEITLRTYMEDGSMYIIDMGAIEFKMNKVYRPSLNLSDFELLDLNKVAEIEHTFENDGSDDVYALPVSMQAGSTPILQRSHFEYLNIPSFIEGLQCAAIVPSVYPTVNKIKALTEGWVYIMVGASGSSTASNTNKAYTYFVGKDWKLLTALPLAAVNEATAATAFCYQSAEDDYAALLIFGKYMSVNEEFDLSTYDVGNFQGIRPIAKKITNNHDKYLILPFDFSNDQQEWPIQTSFAKVLENPYTGSMTYNFLNDISYALDFSYTDNGDGTYSGACSLHKEKYLLMHVRNSETGESVKLPAIEGYKLVEVKGTTNGQTAGTECFICSVSAHEYAVATEDAKEALKKSNVYEMASGNNASKWLHSMVDPAANTAYYLVAIDDTPAGSPHEDLRMASLNLTYQKVE